jgi:hypothetical protein
MKYVIEIFSFPNICRVSVNFVQTTRVTIILYLLVYLGFYSQFPYFFIDLAEFGMRDQHTVLLSICDFRESFNDVTSQYKTQFLHAGHVSAADIFKMSVENFVCRLDIFGIHCKCFHSTTFTFSNQNTITI